MPSIFSTRCSRKGFIFEPASPKIEPFARIRWSSSVARGLQKLRAMKWFTLTFLAFFISCGPVLPIENPFEQAGETPAVSEEPVGPNLLKIIALDVGQGDATLVIGPAGKTLLVDAGPPTEGILTILPELTSLGIDRLDFIVATHYDADHIGGIGEVLQGLDEPPLLFDRGDFTDKSTPAYSDYNEITAPYRTEATPGLPFDLGQGAVAEVTVVNGHYRDGRVIHLNPDEENEASIGLLIRYGEFRYFTAGDLTGGGSETKDLESIAGEVVGNIDILHVGHHGSTTSTNENFLDLTRPEAAVISVGRDNDYGHPSEIVLKRLEKAGVAVYRTDLMGTLEITTDGNNYGIAPR